MQEIKTSKDKLDSKRNRVRAGRLLIGQTLETNDRFLPHKAGKVPERKSRPVIIANKQLNPKGVEEYSIIPGSTKKTKNTTYYGKNGIEFYRHNVEVRDNEGNPITQNEKFKVTKKSSVLPNRDIDKIRNKVVNHTKFSSENKKKVVEFKNRYILTEDTKKFLSEEQVRLKKVPSKNIDTMLKFWEKEPKSKYRDELCKIYKNELNSRNKKSRD